MGVLALAAGWLAGRGVERSRLDAEWLLAHTLGCDRLALYLAFDRPVSEPEKERFRALLKRRAAGEPVAYLVGHWGFHALDFVVDPRVLVPRPDTEVLVEAALDVCSAADPVRFADVGIGSGCVALSLLAARPNWSAVGGDVSAAALEVARTNAERLGLTARIVLAEGDLLAPWAAEGAAFDLVLSNPPYVVRDDPALSPGVRAHEPAVALFVAGDDPLEVALRLAAEARLALKPGGWLLFEVGHTSATRALALLEANGWSAARTWRDLAGIERVVGARRP